jgi:hypothetical protein
MEQLFASYTGKSILCFLVWGSIASILLFYTWNHVIAHITKLKKVKFYHAVLVVLTIAVFCAPKHNMKKHRYGKGYASCEKQCSGKQCKGLNKAKKADCGCSKADKKISCDCKKGDCDCPKCSKH